MPGITSSDNAELVAARKKFADLEPAPGNHRDLGGRLKSPPTGTLLAGYN